MSSDSHAASTTAATVLPQKDWWTHAVLSTAAINQHRFSQLERDG